MDEAALLKRAKRRVNNLQITVCADGWVHLCWERPFVAYLAEVVTHDAASLEESLLQLIEIEDGVRRRRMHGPDCGCEDCCIDRIDQSRYRVN